MKKRYVIKSHIRFISFVTITAFIFLTIFINLIGLNNDGFISEASEIKSTMAITVEYGDTIWNLAEKYGSQNDDIRKVVYEICESNGITADSLRPGQTIYIPC